jgi:hypothetical protein
MTEPNKLAKSDILAARELVKLRNHPAHYAAIDAGKWDAFDNMQNAIAEVIRKAKEGDGDE